MCTDEHRSLSQQCSADSLTWHASKGGRDGTGTFLVEQDPKVAIESASLVIYQGSSGTLDICGSRLHSRDAYIQTDEDSNSVIQFCFHSTRAFSSTAGPKKILAQIQLAILLYDMCVLIFSFFFSRQVLAQSTKR